MTDKTPTGCLAQPDSLSPEATRRTPESERPAVLLADRVREAVHPRGRADALAGGSLVGVCDDIAREAGFRVPVALTAAAWADCVAWAPEDSDRQTYQDESGRLWDVLWMTWNTVRRASGRTSCTVELCRIPRDGASRESQPVRLDVTCGPGDAGEPVITISLRGPR